MGKIVEKIIETENLHWAWKKVKNSFQVGDIWYDEIELALFEANLYQNLEDIKEKIKSGSYSLSTIKPLPFPKSCDKITGIQRVRQTFDIRIKDQVVWMAVVNVIGNSLDYQMPWWSYGHRLYVPVWKNENDRWVVGWYTHSKGQLYRKWNQSWPLFRRNISLTAKIMCSKKAENSDLDIIDSDIYDDAEKVVCENNKSLPERFKSKYLEKNYWGARSANNLFWGTIDFSEFYPKIKRSAILKNILKYTLNAEEDTEFKILLTRLMDFKICSEKWYPNDLKEIKLDVSNFQGLPTGLFVAGFLANVALLSVDEKISTKLNSERDIAHFRFVDDHVILSYDFNKLQDWITTYKRYLEEAGTGAEFNYDKIEPKSLANILDSEWTKKNRKKIKSEQHRAKKDCTLDPAFPAPLMTQTLAKVSAINKSDFEFLSHNEEEQLIADLEHLLLTDFPDHELRKDTRVSFAASVLSRIVPNTKDDYSEVYESQKRIHHKLKDYQKKFEKSNNKFITDKLHDLIFSNNLIDNYFTNWENSLNETETDTKEKKVLITLIKNEKANETKLKKKIYDQKRLQKERVYRLLIKAISENPEKVRIWSRVIDYCKMIGECQIKDAYNKIGTLSGQSVHPLSASFLRTLFMNVLADRLLQVVYSILNKNLKSIKEKKSAEHFIETIFDEQLLKDIFGKEEDEGKLYYLKSYEFFRFVLGSTIFILKESSHDFKYDDTNLRLHKLIDWNNNPQEWINKTQISNINAWLFWLLWKTHDKISNQPLAFWEKLTPYINYSDPSYKPLIQAFPNYIYLPKNDDSFLKNIMNNGFDEGWLYEVFKTGKENLSKEVKNELRKKYSSLYKNVFSEDATLWDFIQWQKQKLTETYVREIDSYNRYFDPRLSEWTALELIKQIIEKINSVDDFFMDNSEIKLHLSNFIISKDIMIGDNILSWYDWKKKMRKNKIKVSSFQISDERYSTKGLLESEQRIGQKAKVHALGIMLLQIITHDTNLPWVWNSTDKSLILENLFYKKIQNTSLSSYVMLILQACFSSKNREMSNWGIEVENAKGDVATEIPAINDIYTLNKYIKKAQEIIESYQLSMENNAPRQLLPVSLKQFSVQNNPFEDINENTE